MKNFLKIWIVSFAGILIPILYSCFNIFVMVHEDGKMGAVGTLLFDVFFYLVLGIINATVFGITYHFNTKEKPSRKILLYTFLFNSLLFMVAIPIYFLVGFIVPFVFLGFSMFISVAMYESI